MDKTKTIWNKTPLEMTVKDQLVVSAVVMGVTMVIFNAPEGIESLKRRYDMYRLRREDPNLTR